MNKIQEAQIHQSIEKHKEMLDSHIAQIERLECQIETEIVIIKRLKNDINELHKDITYVNGEEDLTRVMKIEQIICRYTDLDEEGD